MDAKACKVGKYFLWTHQGVVELVRIEKAALPSGHVLVLDADGAQRLAACADLGTTPVRLG